MELSKFYYAYRVENSSQKFSANSVGLPFGILPLPESTIIEAPVEKLEYRVITNGGRFWGKDFPQTPAPWPLSGLFFEPGC